MKTIIKRATYSVLALSIVASLVVMGMSSSDHCHKCGGSHSSLHSCTN